MDQEITGSAGIASAEAFGLDGHPIQTLLVGTAGIPSGEQFAQVSGVFIDPFSVPAAVWLSF